MKGDVSAYPARDRTAWILAQRPPRPAAVDPFVPHGVFRERIAVLAEKLIVKQPSRAVQEKDRSFMHDAELPPVFHPTHAQYVPPGT